MPILDSLLPVLKAWKLKTGGQRTVAPPMRSDGRHCDDHTLRSHLGDVLRAIKLLPANDTHQDAKAKRRPRLNWYRCTRHTFASHWVMDGRLLRYLYRRVAEDLFQHLDPEDLAAMSVDLRPAEARTGAFGYAVATQEVDARAAKP